MCRAREQVVVIARNTVLVLILLGSRTDGPTLGHIIAYELLHSQRPNKWESGFWFQCIQVQNYTPTTSLGSSCLHRPDDAAKTVLFPKRAELPETNHISESRVAANASGVR